MPRSIARRRAGYSLTEVAITLSIIALAVGIAVPSLNRATENGDLRDTAVALDGGLVTARGEAIRTGEVQLFFLFEDAEGNPLRDANGEPVPGLIVNDGAPGSANQNCRIDQGERVITMSGEQLKKISMVGELPEGVERPDLDLGLGQPGDRGSSFVDPAGNSVTYVMFRPEGMPMSFDANCNLGLPGSGAGSVYMKNEDRVFVVSLSPMGTTKVLAWNHSNQSWE